MFLKQFISILRSGPRNIRQRLLRDTVSLIFILIAVLLGVFYYLGSNVREQASAKIIAKTSELVRGKFYNFISPVEAYLKIGYQWGKNGLIYDLDTRELCRIFIPMLKIHPYIYSVSLANSKGKEFFLTRKKGKWVSRKSVDINGERLAYWEEWLDSDHILRNWQEETQYDPRARPWFLQVEKSKPGTISWTDPYHFYMSGRQGVTASISWISKKDNALSVIAFDLLEEDLLRFLTKLRIGKRGHIILLGKDGSLIVHNKSPELQSIDQSPAVLRALELWRSSEKKNLRVFEFRIKDQSWWAGFSALKDEEPSAWMAVLVPEAEIMGGVEKRWIRIGIIASLVLGIGVVLAFFLVRRYSYQLKDLPRQKIYRQNLDEELLKLIKAGESPTLEFKSTIRRNLKTGKNGKEIELAWLKTVVAFMNSDGGILLIGVNDGGEIVGIEADEFENDDRCLLHCKSLINTHVGPEFSRFIHLNLYSIDAKTIVVVECERVRKPVFLTIGKNEDFYVRSGPSSIKLSMSQMIKYLNERR